METIWFITGTSSGLGKALTALLTSLPGHFVYGFSRNEIARSLNYHHFQIDLSQSDSVLDFQFPDFAAGKRIVLINNAAQLGQMAVTGNLTERGIYETYLLNVVAPHILANKFLRSYRNYSAEKVIIQISSGAATSPYDGWGLYCSSKAALQMQAQVMHAESNMQTDQIRVYAFAPGVLNTAMQSEIRNADPLSFSRKQKFIDLLENGELIDPARAAADVLKLVSNPQLFKDCIYRFPL